MAIRQPIITVAGHVDHGKTSILDSLRKTAVAEKEAGAITQKISFSDFPKENLIESWPIIKKQGIKLEIPGFLFIDTPGHAAFNNLRKRGGNLADLAILVIDINEGVKPQTQEVIQILKLNKTPFVITLNKIDRIRGWSKISGNLKENIEKQPQHVRQDFDEKYFTLIGVLNNFGFEPELFYNIKDFTKNIAVIPCSAKTGEGIPEIILVLAGLSQKFLKERLKLGKEAKGVVLELKKEKSLSYIESILYDGILKVGDELAIARFDGFIKTKVKAIEKIQPLSFKFKPVDEVSATAGIRMQITSKEEILPGMPFMHFSSEEKVKEEFKIEVKSAIKPDKKGIIIKADSLGSLEALIVLLKQANIKFVKFGIGPINKNDILAAKANLEIDKLDAVVAGFNIELDEDAKSLITKDIKVITNEVIYKIIEDLQEFREEKSREIERERLMKLARICKLEVLHQYVFRNTNPAIFGVKVLAGKITPGTELIAEDGEEIGRIKNIQSENKPVDEATSGMEVAISIPGTNFERKLSDKKFLYSNISEKQFKKFKDNKDLLASNEISVLQEIKTIKQKKTEKWGG